MKIFVLIAAVALGIFLVARMQQPVRPVASIAPSASTAAPAVPSSTPEPSALRRPIAKTQAVLKEVESRTGAGEF